MDQWRNDARKEPIIIDIDSLVPTDHLLRKIEKVMDYEWLYERLEPYYCHDNGRPEKIIGLTLILDFFDRCHSLTSLYLPLAALGSLPLALTRKGQVSLVTRHLLFQIKPISLGFDWSFVLYIPFSSTQFFEYSYNKFDNCFLAEYTI